MNDSRSIPTNTDDNTEPSQQQNQSFARLKNLLLRIWRVVSIPLALYAALITFTGSPHDWRKSSRERSEKYHYYQRAQQFAHEQRYEDAIENVNLGLGIGDDDPVGLALLVRLKTFKAVREGAHTPAERRYLQYTVELHPSDAESWTNLGLLHYYLGEYTDAQRAYDRALQLLQTIHRPSPDQVALEIDALYLSGLTNLNGNYYAGAALCASKLKHLASQEENRRAAGYAGLLTGAVARFHGDINASISELETSRGIFQSANDHFGEMSSQFELGKTFLEAMNLPRALECFDKAMARAKEMTSNRYASIYAQYKGDVLARQCRFAESLAVLKDSCNYEDGSTDPQARATCMLQVANTALQAEDYLKAKRLLDEAVPIFRELGDSFNLAVALNSQGGAMIYLGYEEALSRLQEARDIFLTKSPYPLGVSYVDLNMAIYYRVMQKDPVRAEKLLRGVLENFPSELVAQRSVVLGELGETLSAEGKKAEAREQLELAMQGATADTCLSAKLRESLRLILESDED